MASVSYLDIHISSSGLLYVLNSEIQDLSNMDEILDTCHKEWISIPSQCQRIAEEEYLDPNKPKKPKILIMTPKKYQILKKTTL